MRVERPRSKIQNRNRAAIMEAALVCFAQYGFRGATLDQIAEGAGLSRSSVLYYFTSKDEIYDTLLCDILRAWVAPMSEIRADGDPVEELMAYIRRKMELTRQQPLHSRIFGNAMLENAPCARAFYENEVKPAFRHQITVIQGWIAQRRLANIDPVNLMFSVWALSQQYSSFDLKVNNLMGETGPLHVARSPEFVETLYRSMLEPELPNGSVG